jgi:SAM-dependent methyltransferase
MDTASFETELRRLGSATMALAAIAALLRTRAEAGGDPHLRQALTGVANAVAPGAVDGLDDEQAAAMLQFITVQLSGAHDLLRGPQRGAGWAYHDPVMLQAQGDISRAFPRRFAAIAKERPDFAAAFEGRFLDIGVGVASLALEAAAQFPRLQVVGLDIWEPSLALARAHIATSAYADRVQVRAQDVTTLDEPETYTAIWFPILFFPKPVVEAAMPRVALALRPGGWLIIPRASAPSEGLPAALGALQMLRQGGARWSDDDLCALAEASGFRDIAFVDGPGMIAMPGSRLLLARR